LAQVKGQRPAAFAQSRVPRLAKKDQRMAKAINPAMAAAEVVSVEDAAMDAKTALNQFCQRLCQRPVTRSDIEYTVNKIGVQFQAIVKLNCVQGQEFAGELASNPKDAEKAAAEQALNANREIISTLPPAISSRWFKTERTQSGSIGVKPLDEDNPALTAKVKLNSICMRIVKRALQKGETNYETLQAAGGFHTTLKLSCLPDDWPQKAWAGKICPTKEAAEQSAASYALDAIQADDALMSIADKAKASREEKGKGRGKNPSPMGKGFGKGKKGMDLDALGDAMQWPPRETGPDLQREHLTELPVQGEVLDWRAGCTFGWFKLDMPFEHKNARRDGKVYVHKQDLSCDADAIKVGTKVKFSLYADTAGLGGEQVALV